MFRFACALILTLLLTANGSLAAVSEAEDLTSPCLQSDPFQHTENTISVCTKAVEQPNLDRKVHAQLFAMQGEAQYWARDYPAALAAFNQALALDDSLNDTRIFKGWALVWTKDYEAAHTTFAIAEKTDGTNARSAFALGWMELNIVGNRDGIELMEEALRRQRTFFLAHSGLGAFYRDQMLDYPKALEHFEAILSADEAEVNKTKFRGTAEFAAKEFYGYTLFNKAVLLRYMGRSDDAQELLKKLVVRFPQEPGPCAELATNLNDQRRFQDAYDTANACLSIAPKYADVLLQKLISAVNLKKNSEAIAVSSAALENKCEFCRGSISELYFYSGMAFKAVGRNQEARNYFLAAFQSNAFYLSAGITQFLQSGYYQGQTTDPMSPNVELALRACLEDPKCMTVQ